MAKKPPSPAQRAAQHTFLLKEHLKNTRVAYLRAAVGLAKVRDEQLWKLLRHPSIVDYAWKQLRLKEATLFEAIRAIEATLASTRSVAGLSGLKRSTLARLGVRAGLSAIA
jgi:hypothetical protein